MKIRAIVCASNDHRHTAFRAEPVATEEVVEFALKNYLGETVATEYSKQSRPNIPLKTVCLLIPPLNLRQSGLAG
jgi:hypothetical protein